MELKQVNSRGSGTLSPASHAEHAQMDLAPKEKACQLPEKPPAVTGSEKPPAVTVSEKPPAVTVSEKLPALSQEA